MMKTNQAWAKRLRVTRRGKILARPGGQNHFNAKQSRGKQLAAKRPLILPFKTRDTRRFLP